MPFLRGAPERLVDVKCTAKEQRFIKKVTSASVVIPKDAWSEWKQYRLRLWRSSKSWAGEDKKEDENKDKEDKKDE